MLDEMLAKAHTIAIGGHVRPDGDCVGSCMGMYLYIRNKNPRADVTVYLKDIPDKFRFLKGSETIRETIPLHDGCDLFICQDCGDRERLDFSAPLFDRAKDTLCIDHHVSNGGFARENYIVPDASSTSELVYTLLDPSAVTREVAEALYLGIVHDTGVFQYACTSPETMRIAAALLEKGVDAPRIIRETYYEKSYAQNRILGTALVKSVLYADGQILVSVIHQSDLDACGATPKDMDGVAAQLRNTQGVEVAVLLYELSPGEWKVSLRSGDQVDVSETALLFGGGGHRRAAGCSCSGTGESVRDALLTKLTAQIEGQA